MKIFKNKSLLLNELKNSKNLSFVPTMGGFHAGHKSLIIKAKKKSKKVIVSIYVNPKQFNSKKDFKMYPRNLNKDISILKKLKIDILYLPNYNDIYNFKTKKKIFLDKFHTKLCGKYRPNHFWGVINIINRFLEIINPKYMFLGKKDYQQLYLIKEHIKKNMIQTKIISCNTIRENNGIPCSTRNSNLTKENYLIASKVIKFLKKLKCSIKKNKKIIFNEKQIIKKLEAIGVTKTDYIKLLELNSLNTAINSKKKFSIFVAFYLKNTRLIDNF
jgi:pantoate--beta-alanine ligase